MTMRKPTAKGRTPKAAQGATPTALPDHASLLDAVQMLIRPLTMLCVARGMPYGSVEELLKTAFVDAARASHPDAAPHRSVSRISTATGLNRREVSRLMRGRAGDPPPRRSPATEVFTRWISEPSLRNAQGRPRALPRQGPAPSFEELARSVNRDVHPRSLLEELRRLGLVRLDGEKVHVMRDSFVPKQDIDRMLGFLGRNVGDHLRAAVANVLSDPPPYLEQAVFADEVSQASLEQLQEVMRAQWQALLQASVPLLHRLIEADSAAKRTQDKRVRIGVYLYSEPMAGQSESSAAKAPTTPGKAEPRGQ